MPSKVMGLFGILDDVAVTGWIYNKIQKKITPEIRQETEATLTSWFGPEILFGPSPS